MMLGLKKPVLGAVPSEPDFTLWGAAKAQLKAPDRMSAAAMAKQRVIRIVTPRVFDSVAWARVLPGVVPRFPVEISPLPP